MTVQMILGDCLTILPTLTGIDAVITDPPYGLGEKLNGGSWGNVTEWDVTQDVSGLLTLAPVVVIWGGNYYPLPPSRCWYTWYKPDAPPSMSKIELAWTNQDKNSQIIKQTIAATNAERVGHPTQKPVAVMMRCILDLTKPGDTILDPYMGSGTTGVACMKTGRNFIGIEKSERWFKVAQERVALAQMQPSLLEV